MENQKQRIALWRLLGLAQGVRDAMNLNLVFDKDAVLKRMIEIVREYEKENTKNEPPSKVSF